MSPLHFLNQSLNRKGRLPRQLSRWLRIWPVAASAGLTIMFAVSSLPAQGTGNTGQSEFRRFDLPNGKARDAEAFLRNRLIDVGQYRIFTNPDSSNEIVVVGDAKALELSEKLIQEFERPFLQATPDANGARTIPRNEVAREDLANESWQQIELRRINLQQIQASIEDLFRSRIKVKPTRNGAMYELALTDQTMLRFGGDWNSSVVNISGPPEMVDQFVTLVSKLDDELGTQSSPNLLAYRNASSFSVQRLLDAYGGDEGSGARSQTFSSSLNSTNPPSGAVLPNPVGRAAEAGVYAATPNQDPLPLPGGTAPGQSPIIIPNPDEPNQTELLRQIQDSVQVETLPDLGIIILRGRQKEVQELSRIIQELERLSAETQPEVQIVNLEHSSSESVVEILQSTSADLVSGRSGRVTVTSLGKPNSLLLIGWGEAVTVIVDLIKKLDQPVAPESQFEVFRLADADVNDLQTSLNSFFTSRDGMGTKVQVITDARTNSIVAYGSPRDLQEVRRLVSELDGPNYRSRHQARIVRVKNAVASELATTLLSAINGARGTGPQSAAFMELLGRDADGQRVLESGILDEVQITPNPVNNSLILSGPAESMNLLEALVEQLDVAGANSQIKIFRIEHGDASTLVQMLRSLLPEQTVDRPALKMGGGEEQSLAPLRFSVDSRTNSIIATGSEGDLQIVYALLLRLDEKEFSERKTMVYRLKNAPASDVATAINNFLRSERQVQQAGSQNVSPFEQLEREVIVVPEPIGNRLILSATPRFFTEIEELINQLDEPPPQVMIQVMIAEVTLDNTREFGIELGLQDSVLFDRSLLGNLVTTTSSVQSSTPGGVVTSTEQVIQAASNEPGFAFNNSPLGNSGSNLSLGRSNVVGTQGLSNFSVGRINNELGFGGLVLSASSESVTALLRALQECRRMEILSRPQIRTLDNQPAFIQVGQRVPRIIGSTVNQNGQSNSIALENVGLILGVTPRISPDGTVVMEVDAERSGLGPENEGIPVSVSPNGNIIRSPRVDTTTAQATVSAASGETIILGGLITKKTTTIDRKVPWLGDIPLLGNLFRYDGDFTRRAELLIILTPYVIRDRGDEERLQQMEFARMNWCLGDVESLHGSLDGAFNPVNLDYDSPQTLEFYPNESPVNPGPPPNSILEGVPPPATAPAERWQYDQNAIPIRDDAQRNLEGTSSGFQSLPASSSSRNTGSNSANDFSRQP